MSAYGDPVTLLGGSTIVRLWSCTLILWALWQARTVKASAANQSSGLTGNKNSRERVPGSDYRILQKRSSRNKSNCASCTSKWMFQGTKVPGSELARVLLEVSLHGANWPGAKRLGTPQPSFVPHPGLCCSFRCLVCLTTAWHHRYLVHNVEKTDEVTCVRQLWLL